jgi:hypothetical protein
MNDKVLAAHHTFGTKKKTPASGVDAGGASLRVWVDSADEDDSVMRLIRLEHGGFAPQTQ